MILLADSGSTKTDWVLVDKNSKSTTISTQGFNPFFYSSIEITEEINRFFPDSKTNTLVQKIFFYGAGCSSDAMKEIIIKGLQPVFKNALIAVMSDLLGAARALFFNKTGIAVILGTGSSTCLYDGNSIIQTVKSLGYVFGDEGGGDHIGKLFITKFLTDSLPKDITNKFNHRFNLSKDQILRKIYSEPMPNNFLASFCEFIAENKSVTEIEHIINQSFSLLFENHIRKYPDYKNQKIRVTGTIGHIFETQLNFIANQYECKIDLIIQKPISKLLDYHLNKYE